MKMTGINEVVRIPNFIGKSFSVSGKIGKAEFVNRKNLVNIFFTLEFFSFFM